MIILTANQADQVRGLTVKGHALAPRPLANGTFALPVSVLTDPAHAKRWALLKTLPIVADGSIHKGTKASDSDWSYDAALLARSSYSSDWKVGEAVATTAKVI